MSVGANIKKFRLEKGLTQEELGNLLGVKKAAIQKYESGQVQNLKQSIIRRLCEVFDKTPSHFIYDDFDAALEDMLRSEVGTIELIQKTYGNEVVSILEVFVGLNNQNKNKVLEYANDISIVQSVKSKV